MKLQNLNLTNPIKQKQTSQVSFSGYKNDYSSKGEEVIKFFAPPGDKSGYELYLEYTHLKKQGEHWVEDEEIGGSSLEPMDSTKPLLVPKSVLPEGPDSAFGYRFVLKKGGAADVRMYDPGAKSQEASNGAFNVLLSNVGGVSKSGPMYHILPDSYHNPEWKDSDDKQDILAVRNHYNIAGGNIKGMIEKAKEGDLDAYGLVISTPLFGKDEISSHGYWTTNPYQISSMRGDLQDFKDLNIELFNRGKQYVADGAFTSQGYQSPLLQHALKWGKDSPYYDWFKFDTVGNQYSSKVSLGILPNTELGIENSRYKIVNASFGEDGRSNPDYDPSKPTYIQFYDQRLASEDQKNDKANLITKYANKTAADAYDISSHQDATWPYSFEINPADKTKISKLMKFESTSIGDITNFDELFSFDNLTIDQKTESKGASFWDGNLDLVKMNLSNPNGIDKNTQGKTRARNYLYNVAAYWTKTTHNALLENLALNQDRVDDVAGKNGIKEEELEEIRTAISSGKYQNNLFKDAPNNAYSFILDEVMDFPLEAIEVAPDLSAVLSSPYITPSAEDKYQLNARKADLVKTAPDLNKGMKEIYTKTVPSFVTAVLRKMDEGRSTSKIFNGDKLTEYGQFIARLITPELTKFALVKGVTGEDGTVGENGTINYGDLSQHNIYSTGIVADKQAGPKGEAGALVKKIAKNTGELNDSAPALAKMFNAKYGSASLKAFKTAQAVVEKSGAGLNWRFDAAKDVADLGGTKSDPDTNTFEHSLDNMIDFWTPFVSRIKEQNPNSMSIAEITDFWNYFKWSGATIEQAREANKQKLGKYLDPERAEQIFYEKTGATTGSNYSQFFGLMPQLYGQSIEEGYNDSNANISKVYKALMEGLDGRETQAFLKNNQLAFITNNHIFVDNHDKPRVLHGMALDMELFLAEVSKNKDKQREATNIAKDIFANANINTDVLSTKGIAVAKLYRDHAKAFDCDKGDIDKAIVNIITKGGTVKDGVELQERSRAFGTRPLEITIKDVAKKLGVSDAKAQEVLEGIMKTPLQKFENMWGLMIALGGVPTIFNGEEYGQTGHETPSKNQELGCRNMVLHNRKNDGSAFSKFYQHINATSGLHNLPGLSALSGGMPTAISQRNDDVIAIHKYDDKGSEVISVLADVGLDRNDLQKPIGKTTPVGAILLHGTRAEGTFIHKVWNGSKYVDENAKYIAKDGVLKKEGGDIELTEGANIFFKAPAGYEPTFTGNPHVKLHNTKYAIPV